MTVSSQFSLYGFRSLFISASPNSTGCLPVSQYTCRKTCDRFHTLSLALNNSRARQFMHFAKCSASSIVQFSTSFAKFLLSQTIGPERAIRLASSMFSPRDGTTSIVVVVLLEPPPGLPKLAGRKTCEADLNTICHRNHYVKNFHVDSREEFDGKENENSHDVSKCEDGKNCHERICGASSSHNGKGNTEDHRIDGWNRAAAQEEIVMPTLKDYRADFYTFTGKASDITRQLAFAGIALIWIFKTDRTGTFRYPSRFNSARHTHHRGTGSRSYSVLCRSDYLAHVLSDEGTGLHR